MGKKFNISEEEKKMIYNDCLKFSLREVSKKYGYSKDFINKVYKNYKKPTVLNRIEFLTCKQTNKKFHDVFNKSGILTKHLNTLNVKFNKQNYLDNFNIHYIHYNDTRLYQFVLNLNVDFKLNYKLDSINYDFFFPKKNILIKIIKLDNTSHLEKNLLKSEYNGLKLIQVYEDELNNKREIIEDKIKHLLLLNNKKEKIYARKCNIREIESSEKNKFLNKNHLQGEDRSSIKYGAYYNDILVAVMTFDNNRNMINTIKKNNSNEYELKRFATNIEYNVIGIGSKMLSFFIKNNKFSKIISFADRRFTLDIYNNLYMKLNFRFDTIIQKDYYVVDIIKKVRSHKFLYMNKKLDKKLELYDKELSFDENLKNNSLIKMFDCGKIKFIYDNI